MTAAPDHGEMVDDGGTRIGVCLVRVETDASAGLLFTVSARLDVNDAMGEIVLRTAVVDDAVEQVRRFLTDFAADR